MLGEYVGTAVWLFKSWAIKTVVHWHKVMNGILAIHLHTITTSISSWKMSKVCPTTSVILDKKTSRIWIGNEIEENEATWNIFKEFRLN